MMSAVSKFKFLPILLASYISILPVMLIYLCYNSPYATMTLPILFLFFILVFWGTVFRTRAHRVTIDQQCVVVKRYFGIGKSESYALNSLDGFVSLFESGKLGVSENLFILQKGKRVVCISEFYHSNYGELKKILIERLINFGVNDYDVKEEWSNLFK